MMTNINQFLKKMKKSSLLINLGRGESLNEEDLLNVYGCRPFPRPEAHTFASSTATSISNFAFGKAETARISNRAA